MRVIIAGSRSITDYNTVCDAMAAAAEQGVFPTEVVSGTARGVDRLGERWAQEHKIPVTQFKADWEQHGRAAGYLRNRQMAEYARAEANVGACVLVWDGVSNGTRHMAKAAAECGLTVVQIVVKSTG